MKLQLMFAAFCSLALVACGTTGGVSSPGSVLSGPPATLERTVIDDRAIKFAFEAFDTVLFGVDFAVAAKKVTPGTPKALAVRRYIQETQHYLNAASSAQRAGSASNYADAFANATKSLAQLRASIK